MLAESKRLQAPLMLTVNAFYSDEQLPYVAKLCAQWEEMGGHGIMVADPALLVLLKKRNSRLIRGLSLLAVAANSAALSFYSTLGISRVVLPRFLLPDEMGKILRACPGLEGEALVWLDKCRYIDGYCRFLHTTGYLDAPPGLSTHSDLTAWDLSYRIPACWELEGLPPELPACAACSVEALARNDIHILKMGGRGRSLATRIAGIRFLRDSMKLPDKAARRALYRLRFGSACCAQICYEGGPC